MIWQITLILSLIQGITEFIPVSSSGHLVLLPYFLDTPYQGRAFDVYIHLGSLLAVLIYLRTEIILMVKDLLSTKRAISPGYLAIKNIFIATIPVVSFGVIIVFLDLEFSDYIETVGWMTLLFGVLLGLSDKIKVRKDLLNNSKDILIIGLFQSLALIPGVSRSGIVITLGRFLGYNRIQASKFSLLLSIPVIFAAAVLKTGKIILENGTLFRSDFILGFVLSFVFSYLTIKVFMKYIEKASLRVFVVYRILLGVLILSFIYSN